MKNLKNIIFVLIILVIIVSIIMINQEKKETSSKPVIAVSSFALYDILKHLSGDTIKIINIVPYGVDIHSFTPSPKLMASIEQSTLFIYNGAGLESWIENSSFKNKTIDLSKHINLRKLRINEFEFHQHHDQQCAHSKIDPHYWLDIQNMMISTNVITQELIQISPQYKEFYIKNAQSYMNNLKLIDKEYTQNLHSCNLNNIVTNHNAFSYISDKFGFHIESLSGLSPQSELSEKDIKRVREYAKNENVSTIFFESLMGDKAVQSVAKHLDVVVDVLEPLENITKADAENNVSYEMLMRKNLLKLSKALMCK